MSDLIDRQKAKDAIDMALDHIDHVPPWVYDNLLNALNEVPSVKPTPSKALGALDCVDRQAAMKIRFSSGFDHDGILFIPYRDVEEHLKKLPSVQPKERCIANITVSEEDLERIVKEQVEEIKDLLPRKGKWIDKGKEFIIRYSCSECGSRGRYVHNFCPNCGADMRGEEDE